MGRRLARDDRAGRCGMSGDWDELLAEAQEKLAEQQDDGPNAELGDETTPPPEEDLRRPLARRRDDADQARHRRRLPRLGPRRQARVPVYRHARLAVEVDVERPEVGDEVLILRGPTEHVREGRRAADGVPVRAPQTARARTRSPAAPRRAAARRRRHPVLAVAGEPETDVRRCSSSTPAATPSSAGR